MGVLGNNAVLSHVVECLGDDKLEVSNEAEHLLRAIAEIRDPESPLFRDPMLALMVKLAKEHQNSTVRLRAHEVLFSASASSADRVKK